MPTGSVSSAEQSATGQFTLESLCPSRSKRPRLSRWWLFVFLVTFAGSASSKHVRSENVPDDSLIVGSGSARSPRISGPAGGLGAAGRTMWG